MSIVPRAEIMVVLVNASVNDRCCSQTVLPWTIFDLGDDSLSLSDFYEHTICHDYDCQPEGHELKEARVGRLEVLIPSVTLVRTHSIILILDIKTCCACVCVCVCVKRRGWLKDSK